MRSLRSIDWSPQVGSRDAYVSARCQSASSELAARSGQGREDAMSTARRSRPRLTDSGLRIWRGRVGTVVAVLDCGWQKGQAAHVRVQRAFITANPSGSMCSSQSEGAKGCEEQLALLARLVDPEEQAPRPAEPAGGLSTARRSHHRRTRTNDAASSTRPLTHPKVVPVAIERTPPTVPMTKRTVRRNGFRRAPRAPRMPT